MTRRRTPPTRMRARQRAIGRRVAVVAGCVAMVAFVVAAGTPALAAPPATLEMSSFVADVSGRDVVGGVRTVTVINPNDGPVDALVSLGAAPCDCVVDEAAPSRGTRDGDSWDVGELGPGESATLTVRYVATTEALVGVPGERTTDPMPRGLARWGMAFIGCMVVAGAATAIRAGSAGGAPILRRLRHRDAAVA